MNSISLIKSWTKGTEPQFDLQLKDEFPHAALTLPDAFTGEQPDYRRLEDHVLQNKLTTHLIYENFEPLRFREKFVAFQDLEAHLRNGSTILPGAATDSVTHQAQKWGKLKNNNYAVAGTSCLLRTSDGEHLLFGVRGQGTDIGQIMAVPSGYVAWPFSERFPGEKKVTDPIRNVVLQEAEEELAIYPEDLKSLDLIGVYRLQLTREPWYSFTYFGQLQTPTEEILHRHKTSKDIYTKAKQGTEQPKTQGELQARQTLQAAAKQDRNIAADAWESGELITDIKFDPQDPRVLSESLINYCVNNTVRLRPSTYGVLSLLYLHQYGNAAYQELQKLPSFRNTVSEDFC